MKRRPLRLVSLLLVVGLVMIACGSGDEPGASADADAGGEPAEVKLSFGLFPPEAEQWNFYIAQDEGLFENSGLDVEGVVVPDTTKLTQALISGSVDVAALTPDAVIRTGATGDSNMVLIGAFVNSPSVPLVTAKDIESLEELKGKTIGVSSLTASDTLFVNELMDTVGVGPDEYDIVQVGGSPDRLAALEGGAINGTILSHPYDFKAQAQGFNLVASNTDVVPNYVWVAIATTREFAEANAEVLNRLMESLREATDWLYDPANQEAAMAVLMDELEIDEEIASLAYDFFMENQVISPDVSLDLEGFQNVADFIASQEDLGGTPDINDLVLTDF